MRNRFLTASLATLLLTGCIGDIVTPDKFRIVGSVTTHLAVDTVTCTITWRSAVNDNRFPYVFEFSVAGDTGTLPDTGFMVAADSGPATGPASVEGTFRAPDMLVGWRFLWDTLSASDSVHVKGCAVQ